MFSLLLCSHHGNEEYGTMMNPDGSADSGDGDVKQLSWDELLDLSMKELQRDKKASKADVRREVDMPYTDDKAMVGTTLPITVAEKYPQTKTLKSVIVKTPTIVNKSFETSKISSVIGQTLTNNVAEEYSETKNIKTMSSAVGKISPTRVSIKEKADPLKKMKRSKRRRRKCMCLHKGSTGGNYVCVDCSENDGEQVKKKYTEFAESVSVSQADMAADVIERPTVDNRLTGVSSAPEGVGCSAEKLSLPEMLSPEEVLSSIEKLYSAHMQSAAEMTKPPQILLSGTVEPSGVATEKCWTDNNLNDDYYSDISDDVELIMDESEVMTHHDSSSLDSSLSDISLDSVNSSQLELFNRKPPAVVLHEDQQETNCQKPLENNSDQQETKYQKPLENSLSSQNEGKVLNEQPGEPLVEEEPERIRVPSARFSSLLVKLDQYRNAVEKMSRLVMEKVTKGCKRNDSVTSTTSASASVSSGETVTGRPPKKSKQANE